MARRELTIKAYGTEVSALYSRPRGATALFVVAHGAGAGMNHPFMESLTDALDERQVATLRFQFPYMEARALGRRPPPNRASVLEGTVAAAIARSRALARGLPIVVGGKSMGGRMSSGLIAQRHTRNIAGVVFLGFPLHPPKRVEKAKERATHLSAVDVPMLFVHGSRDALGSLARIRPLARRLGADLHVVRGANHGFELLVRDGARSRCVFTEIAEAIDQWRATRLRRC